MEKSGDPPGTKRSANGRLINISTGRFMTDPNKAKSVSSSRRASSRRSAASEKTADDRSRSVEKAASDSGRIQQQVDVEHRGVPSTTPPISAIPDGNRRLRKKTTPPMEFDQVQAQLRKGDPIPVDQLPDQALGNPIPPLLNFLSQGFEGSADQQTPRDNSAFSNIDSDSTIIINKIIQKTTKTVTVTVNILIKNVLILTISLRT